MINTPPYAEGDVFVRLTDTKTHGFDHNWTNFLLTSSIITSVLKESVLRLIRLGECEHSVSHSNVNSKSISDVFILHYFYVIVFQPTPTMLL